MLLCKLHPECPQFFEYRGLLVGKILCRCRGFVFVFSFAAFGIRFSSFAIFISIVPSSSSSSAAFGNRRTMLYVSAVT